MAKVNLDLVHPDLLDVINAALEVHPGRIFSGYRTEAEQLELYARGVSPVTMSKHMMGLAVDVVLFKTGKKSADWAFHRYADFNETVQRIAASRKLDITWGGDWRSRDGVHFQLDGTPLFAWGGERVGQEE